MEKANIQGLTYRAERIFFDLIDNLAVVLWHIYHVLIAALNLKTSAQPRLPAQ